MEQILGSLSTLQKLTSINIMKWMLMLLFWIVSSATGHNILLLLGFSSPSHMRRFWPLIEELQYRGHNITVVAPYVTPPKLLPNVTLLELNKNKAYLDETVNEMLEASLEGAKYLLDFKQRTAKKLAKGMYEDPKILRLLEEGTQFDVLLTDPLLSGFVLPLAKKLNVHMVLLSTSPLDMWTAESLNIPDKHLYDIHATNTQEFSIYKGWTKAGIGKKVEKMEQDVYVEMEVKSLYKRHAKDGQMPRLFWVPSFADIRKERVHLVLINSDFVLDIPRILPTHVIRVGPFHFQKADPLPQDLQDFIETPIRKESDENKINDIQDSRLWDSIKIPREKERIDDKLDDIPKGVDGILIEPKVLDGVANVHAEHFNMLLFVNSTANEATSSVENLTQSSEGSDLLDNSKEDLLEIGFPSGANEFNLMAELQEIVTKESENLQEVFRKNADKEPNKDSDSHSIDNVNMQKSVENLRNVKIENQSIRKIESTNENVPTLNEESKLEDKSKLPKFQQRSSSNDMISKESKEKNKEEFSVNEDSNFKDNVDGNERDVDNAYEKSSASDDDIQKERHPYGGEISNIERLSINSTEEILTEALDKFNLNLRTSLNDAVKNLKDNLNDSTANNESTLIRTSENDSNESLADSESPINDSHDILQNDLKESPSSSESSTDDLYISITDSKESPANLVNDSTEVERSESLKESTSKYSVKNENSSSPISNDPHSLNENEVQEDKSSLQDNSTNIPFQKEFHLSSNNPKRQTVDDRGFVVIDMESVTDTSYLPFQLLSHILSVFDDMEQKVIWITNDPSKLVSRNIRFVEKTFEKDILGHPNVTLLITDCDPVLLQEALYNAIPFVGIPFYVSQETYCRRAESLGLGVVVELSTVTGWSLSQEVTRVITNKQFKIMAEKFSSVFKEEIANSLDTVVRWIEYSIHRNRAVGFQYVEPPKKKTVLLFFKRYLVELIMAFILACTICKYLGMV